MQVSLLSVGNVLVGGGDDIAGVPMHIVGKPMHQETGGHYSLSMQSGAIAAGMAANGEIYQFRWTGVGRVCLIHKFECTGIRATTAFAAGAIDVRMSLCYLWSTQTGAGTTMVNNTAPNDQVSLSTYFPDTGVNVARIAATAVVGTGGKVIQANDLANIITHSSAGPATAAPIIGSIYLPNPVMWKANESQPPIALYRNQGILVRATVPATGVWNIGFNILWSEVDGY